MPRTAISLVPALLAACLGAAEPSSASGEALVDGTLRIAVVQDGGERVLQTAVPVRLGALRAEDIDGPALRRIVAAAEAAKQAGRIEVFTAQLDPLLGACLRASGVVALPEGVLTAERISVPDQAAQVSAITAAAAPVRAAIAAMDPAKRPTDAAVAALDEMFTLLDQGRIKRAIDELSPELARRIVLTGMLGGICPDRKAVGSLQRAVADAVRPVAVEALAGPAAGGGTLRLSRWTNAFGVGGWVLATPAAVRYQVAFGAFQMLGEDPQMDLLVTLPSGADPVSEAGRATAAQVFAKGRLVAAWTAEAGFTSDAAAWREHVTAGYRNAPEHGLPPHVAVHGLAGDLAFLATAHGVLRMDLAGDAFLAAAAKVLPDAAHLDLLGQHAWRYVYDSPDPRYPRIPGSVKAKGEDHATALQSFAAAQGGIMRGDCDDLAELAQTVSERQGRLSYVMSLPGHAACAFAQQGSDGWTVNILQTGPALAFTAKSLPEALTAAYTSFDESEPFNPNQLGLLLRFSGENTRGPWRLSWRIFAEPEYARTMIDVQRDWQYQTYARAIAKMQKLLEQGDKDPANFSELSGLYTFTGQWDKAVEFDRKSIAVTADPNARLQMLIELLPRLKAAGRATEAAGVAKDLIEKKLPQQLESLGEAKIQIGLQLAGALLGADQPELAAKALEQTALPVFRMVMGRLAKITARPDFATPAFQENWRLNGQLQQMRRLSMMWAGLGLTLVEKTPEAARIDRPAVAAAAEDARTWLREIAFRDVDDDGDIAARYAIAARWWMLAKGRERVLADLASVQAATGAKDHAARGDGDEQYAADLPWIKASVPFWNMEYARASHDDPLDAEDGDAPADAAKALAAARAAVAAASAAAASGGETAQLLHQATLCRVGAAVLGDDDAELRAVLRRVKDLNDKRLRDDTAQQLGDLAPLVTADRFARLVDAWEQELDYKPKWFWIAWRAALSGAPDKALLVARRAAKRYADDPSFAEEARFMADLHAQGRLGRKPGSASATAAPVK